MDTSRQAVEGTLALASRGGIRGAGLFARALSSCAEAGWSSADFISALGACTEHVKAGTGCGGCGLDSYAGVCGGGDRFSGSHCDFGGQGGAQASDGVQVGSGSGVPTERVCESFVGSRRFEVGAGGLGGQAGRGVAGARSRSEAVGVSESSAGVGSSSGFGGGESGGAGGSGGGVDEPVVVSERTLANREKRRKAKASKLRKQAEARERKQEEAKVPEWRRNGGVGLHKGVFSDCSQDVQLALRDSRAQMLIAKNKAAVIEAEERARKTAAMLKSRMIEENVEKERLELEKKMKSLRESTALPQGYCETVLSALATPSLSDGTISPDSSISSAEVHKKDEAIRMLVGQCDEQRKETDKFKLKHQETEQRLLATIKRLEALEASTNAARRAREEAARERVRREREEMFGGKQAGEGWAGVKGARSVGKTEHNIDGTTKIVWSVDAEV